MPRANQPTVYVALIGDLVASRALPAKQREDLQEHLLLWLAELNEDLGPALAAPLTLTAGDEIQGLFRKPSGIVTVIQELTDRMFKLEDQPHALYGVGRGALTTGRIPAPSGRAENPAMLDGPAFHLARAALEHVQHEGVWTRFLGFDEPLESALDALFGLMGAIRERWTRNQGKVSYRMRECAEASSPSQRALAAKMGVSPSVISETLKAAHHVQLVDGENAARELLKTLDPRRG